MISALLLIALAQVPGAPPGADNRNRVNSRFRFFGSNGNGAAATCSPACVSPQYCVGTTCTDPQFSAFTSSGIGVTAECACSNTLTDVQGNAISFSRASPGYCSVGDVMHPTSIALCSTNQPRVMKGGAGTGSKGLLMEPAHANFALKSQAFDDATVWVPANALSSNPAVVANAAVAPDGTTTAERVTFPAVGAAGYSLLIQGPLGSTTSAHMSTGVYVKGVYDGGLPDGGSDDGGTPMGEIFTYVYVTAAVVCQSCPYTSGRWSHCVQEDRAVTSFNEMVIGQDVLDNCSGPIAAQDVYLWQADAQPYVAGSGTLEYLTPGLTSPIPTTTSVGTTAGDIATAAYTAAGGTLSMSLDVVEPNYFVNGVTSLNMTIDASNRMRINNSTTTGTTTSLVVNVLTIGGVTGNANSVGSVSGGLQSLAAYYDLVNRAICIGGSCTKSAASLTLPTGAGLIYLGNSSAANLQVGGVIKNVCVDPNHCASYGL